MTEPSVIQLSAGDKENTIACMRAAGLLAANEGHSPPEKVTLTLNGLPPAAGEKQEDVTKGLTATAIAIATDNGISTLHVMQVGEDSKGAAVYYGTQQQISAGDVKTVLTKCAKGARSR